MTKNVLSIIAVTVMAVVAWWILHQEHTSPLSSTADGDPKTVHSAPPFKITRQMFASLANANGAATPRTLPPRFKPKRTGSWPEPDTEIAKRLRQAQTETNAADVYSMIFDRLKTTECKNKLDRIKELLQKLGTHPRPVR